VSSRSLQSHIGRVWLNIKLCWLRTVGGTGVASIPLLVVFGLAKEAEITSPPFDCIDNRPQALIERLLKLRSELVDVNRQQSLRVERTEP
jgi:hypothetical protein